MSEPAVVRGRVRFRETGQPAAQVLAVDERAGAVLSDASSDPQGRFELELPAGEDPLGAGPLLLFARCRGPVAGVALARIADRSPQEVDLAIDRHGDAWPLIVTLDREAPGPPGEPTVSITPIQIAGIAPEEMRWTLAKVREASDSALETLCMSSGALVRTVQAGRWWLRAELLSAYEAIPRDAEPVSSWVNGEAHLEDGTPLTRSHGGFELDIAGPITVRVRLVAERPPATR